MKSIKTTIYLPDDLRKSLKKHIIDTGETMSQFVEKAIVAALENESKPANKKPRKSKKQSDAPADAARELDRIIKELGGK